METFVMRCVSVDDQPQVQAQNPDQHGLNCSTTRQGHELVRTRRLLEGVLDRG